MENLPTKGMPSPGQVARLVGASSTHQKCCGFDPLSRYIPTLQVWSLVGADDGDNRSMFLSHIHVSLCLYLSPINKHTPSSED